MRYMIAAAAALVAGPVLAQDEAQIAEGMALFQQNCRTCHIVREGEHRLGPSLYGVMGREVGTVEGFSFSSSLAGSSEVWDAEHLDAYIADPDGVYSGTRMLYAGMSDPEGRAALIAYLSSEEAGGGGAGEADDAAEEDGADDAGAADGGDDEATEEDGG